MINDSVVFVAHGFTRDNIRLQPWRYLFEIARRIATVKNVVVVTDGIQDAEEEIWDEGITVVRSCHLSVRCQNRLTELITVYKPYQLWWSITPRSIAYWSLFRAIHCEKYAVITCPLYSYPQLVRASLAGVPFDELRALWQQRLVPRRLLTMLLRGRTFKKVFTQSEANSSLLLQSGVQKDKLFVLRVGVDAADREPVDRLVLENEQARLDIDEQNNTLLYFGAIRKIRGFYTLMDAFGLVADEFENVRLVVLARGADEEMTSELHGLIERQNLVGKVQIIGGWLTREQVWAHIELTDLVVLPFIIVPSDVPIAVLEAMARGKPVIASQIDGIPELISERGKVIDPLDTRLFAREICSLINNKTQRDQLGENARDYMEHYPDWNVIGKQAMEEAGLA